MTEQTTTTTYLEYVAGSESHTSNWEQMYVFNLDGMVTWADHANNRKDGHHNYHCHAGNAVPDGTVFVYTYKTGNKYGTSDQVYAIAVTDSSQPQRTVTFPNSYGKVFITGQFRVLAQATTKTKAIRLEQWWKAKPKGIKPAAWAMHLANYIDKRGQVIPPAMPEEI